jgi:hypothetical protein
MFHSNSAIPIYTYLCVCVCVCVCVCKSVDESGVFPFDIIPPWFSMLTYHLGYEQYARLWQQFRDLVSPHRHHHHNHHHYLYNMNDLYVLNIRITSLGLQRI